MTITTAEPQPRDPQFCSSRSSLKSRSHLPSHERTLHPVLDDRIGRGGMGEVFRARHGMLRRPAAIKLLNSSEEFGIALARFEQEVQRTAELTHPNTVRIFDYGRTSEGTFYYAMELLDGADLRRIVRVDGPQRVERVVRILRMVAAALAEAHGINLIHRDIKPANIILCRQGGELDIAKVVDFGLVRQVERSNGESSSGTVAGSPGYMAPEVIADRSPDARSDIYALGAVAYYLLTAREVFEGTPLEVLTKHLSADVVPPSVRLGAPLDVELERFVMDCLSRNPESRPQSTRDVIERLDAMSIKAWTQDDAYAWWSEHGSALGSEVLPSDPRDPAEAATVVVTVSTADLRPKTGNQRSNR